MRIRDRIETLIYGATAEQREKWHREEVAAFKSFAHLFPIEGGPPIPASSNDAIIALRNMPDEEVVTVPLKQLKAERQRRRELEVERMEWQRMTGVKDPIK